MSSDVQPFGKLSNFQFLKASIPSSGNHCYCTSLPLKMTKGCRCRPLVEIHSIIIVHSRWPGSFLKVLRFLTMPNTRPLAPIPCIKPVSSIFHRSAYMTFSIAGKLKSGNQACIASTIAPLTRAVSMRWIWRVLICGLRRKKPSSQYFPTPVAEPPVKRIRLANV